MKRTTLLALSLLAASCTSTNRQAGTNASAQRPNIILIVADDLGYADVGAQGLSKDVKTPNIDSIAKNGVRLTNGYVSCPVCSPTRAGLMTGRYQQRFGHEFNPGPNEAENFGLPTDQVTLAQALKSAGYATGMVGKWHLGFKPEMHPCRRGFDSFYGFLAGAHQYTEPGAGKNAIMLNEKPVERLLTDYLTDDFGQQAESFVNKHGSGEQPFFLYLAFNAVHTPMQAPQRYLDRFADVTDQKRRIMLAMQSAMDDAIGKVLASLRKHKIEDKTLIFFVADNGGPTRGNSSRNEPLSGFKGDAREGGIRVPFLVQWKRKLSGGRTYDKPVIALDIFPTALAAAGADSPAGLKLDGVDLLPYLGGKKDEAPHDALYWRYGQQWAIREGDIKLTHAEEGEPKLFNLASDVAEANDLSSKDPQTAKRLKDKWQAWSDSMEQPRWRSSRGNAATQEGATPQRPRRRARQQAN